MPDTPDQNNLPSQASALLEKLLMEHSQLEDIPPHLSAIEGFDRLYEFLYTVKEILCCFSMGRFDYEVQLQGSMAGYLKALQGNIRHLVWQCQAVAAGDLDQTLECMGELSEAFNTMTRGLIKQNEIISRKQTELTQITNELQFEIKKKEEMATALKASEEIYREKSWRDSLTGLYNRGYFFKAVSLEVQNLEQQKGSHFCLMMMDIDHFKQFNDTYGHLLGDQVIQIVANSLTDTLRKRDICCRYGGEEFAIFLSGTDLEQGRVIAERIRVNISSQPYPSKNVTEPITISIGLSCVASDSLAPDTQENEVLTKALAAADSALYVAKQNGRNQVRLSLEGWV